jgi:hypothetical protein
MIGGDERAFNRTRKILKPFVEKTFFLGKSGAGHTLKLIHNMVCHTIFLTTCEGGRMAQRAGIKLEDMIEVFNVSNARSYISQFRFPRHILSKKWDATWGGCFSGGKNAGLPGQGRGPGDDREGFFVALQGFRENPQGAFCAEGRRQTKKRQAESRVRFPALKDEELHFSR